jgi:uncharacterized protein
MAAGKAVPIKPNLIAGGSIMRIDFSAGEPVIHERGDAPTASFRPRLIVAGIILFITFVLYHDGVPIYTDFLWFGEVGYRGVFSTIIQAKVTLFLAAAVSFFAVFHGNILLARRISKNSGSAAKQVVGQQIPEVSEFIDKYSGKGILLVSLFFSLWAGRAASVSWQDWLNFVHGKSFHLADPIFGKDVSFYIFQLPFLNTIYEFSLAYVVISGIAAVAVHVLNRAIDSWAGLPEMGAAVRGHILALIAALGIVIAVGTRLGAYDLLTNEHGVFTGASYVDVHYRLLAINLQTLALVAASVLTLASIKAGKDFRWPVLGLGAYAIVSVVFGVVIPAAAEKIQVEPNQLALEKPFIDHNISFTRKGFGLEHVKEVGGFPADLNLNLQKIASNKLTMENVRLWDYDYLGKVYSQSQTIKPYYKFLKTTSEGGKVFDIDIDRYPINGKTRQVMLAAREMDVESLPPSAQTWQNQKLAYTHGYGVVMSPVNRIVEGGPDYFLSGLPVTSSTEAESLKVQQPDIYYGQLSTEAVFVDTAQQEFDYPSTETADSGGKQDHYTNYAGKGGIRIGDAPLARLAFSLHLSDPLMLLQNGFKPQTRILYRREIRERLRTIAPFLQQDRDPYMVVQPDSGKLVWIIDCYTISDRFPYSTAQEMTVNPVNYLTPNYIRNSVKATIDAYDGTVNLYIMDTSDPIAQTYAEIYPGLFKPASALPVALKAHLRYPEDLFHLQRAVYAMYHVEDSRVFYQKEDAWAIPLDPNSVDAAAGQGPQRRMEPYYVIMKLPGLNKADNGSAVQSEEEFVLMSPLAPVNREGQNILGWMCARCDQDHYGELVLYRFPQNVSVAGPNQIAQYINSDRVISPQLTLLRSGGSTATLGNLLVIPVDTSLLYVAPLYVEATSSATRLPQLQKVVVAFGQKVAMEDTLEKALASVFGQAAAPPDNPAAPPGAPTAQSSSLPIPALIQKASEQYDRANDALKKGDFASYGKLIQDMGATLKELKNRANTGKPAANTP